MKTRKLKKIEPTNWDRQEMSRFEGWSVERIIFEMNEQLKPVSRSDHFADFWGRLKRVTERAKEQNVGDPDQAIQLSYRYLLALKTNFCEHGWMCHNVDELSRLTFEQQVVTLVTYVVEHEPTLYSGRVSLILTAIYLLRVGLTDFCTC